MGRVMSAACCLVGVITLLIGGGLSISRQNSVDGGIFILAGPSSIYADRYLFFPETGAYIQLNLSDQTNMYESRSLDGNWLYFFEYHYPNSWQLFRVLANGKGRQNILETDSTDTLMWSEDGSWIFYPKPNATGQLDLWRTHMDGRVSQNLTAAHGVYVSPAPLILRGGWVYFTATMMPTPSQSVVGVYRVRMDGSDFQSLTEAMPDVRGLKVVSPDNQWMIVECASVMLCMAATDGSRFGYIQTYAFSDQTHEFVTLLESAGILIAEAGQHLYVVDLKDQLVLWQTHQAISYFSVIAIDPQGEWLYISQDGTTVEAVRTDGSEQHLIPEMEAFSRIWDWTIDGEWLLFEVFQGDKTEIRRLHRDSHTVETLYQLPFNPNRFHWSMDQEWAYFDGETSERYELFRIRPDGSELQNLSAGMPFGAMIYETHVTVIERHWQQPQLLLAGVGFIFIGILTKGRRKKIR